MKYLKIFEDFNNEYPDVFNGNLIRGVKIDKEEFIDDPKLRKVSSGACDDEDYVSFINNYEKLGLPHPLKSVHMFFRPKRDVSVDYYGKTFDIIPQKGAIFGFNRALGGGGLGSTWFSAQRIAENFLGIDLKEYFDTKGNKDYWEPPFTDYYEDKDKFYEEITKYQKMLIDAGVIGTITYEELVKMSKEEGETLQLWTESPCLHKLKSKITKVPKDYKKEPVREKMRYLKAFNEAFNLNEIEEYCKGYLSYLLDDDNFILDTVDTEILSMARKTNPMVILSSKSGLFEWSTIKDYFIPFLSTLRDNYNIVEVRISRQSGYNRIFPLEKIINDDGIPKLISEITIVLSKNQEKYRKKRGLIN